MGLSKVKLCYRGKKYVKKYKVPIQTAVARKPFELQCWDWSQCSQNWILQPIWAFSKLSKVKFGPEIRSNYTKGALKCTKMDKNAMASHSNSRSSKTVWARALGLIPMFPKLNFTTYMGLFENLKNQIWAWNKVKFHQRSLKIHKRCMKSIRLPIWPA